MPLAPVWHAGERGLCGAEAGRSSEWVGRLHAAAGVVCACARTVKVLVGNDRKQPGGLVLAGRGHRRVGECHLAPPIRRAGRAAVEKVVLEVGGRAALRAGARVRGEMNQDAADQCISASKTAMAVGDWDKAIRLLDKAIRLCPDNAVRSAPSS